ncbi:Sodium-independent sulfate anion transporter [Orchesella cincta]|uniref:Sodium-independent sulfate anion transporter n=1 Tax=Orchesella cincta TaxID=48709 RepID=A0A1D2NGQ8_ORCCI|nr:Sodium-independent sulfate anion transporter [Orchesella cincta]
MINGSRHDENEKNAPGCFKAWSNRAFTKKNVARKFPVLEWLPKYTVGKAISDLIAGLTVGLTLIPQGLAMAAVAQLPPQYGLYSAFIGCFVYIVVGSTKEITIGPTAVMAIITLSYINGFIVNFISSPVTSGFTSAAALTICSTQIQSLLGLKFRADGFLDVVRGTIEHFNEIRLNDAMVSLVCCIVLLFLRKLQASCKCMGSLHPAIDKFLWLIATSRSVIVILTCTVVFAMIGQNDLVAFVGDVVPGLPPFQLPPFTMSGNNTDGTPYHYTLISMLKDDVSALIVLPLLALMEHISIAKAYAGSGRVDASQEMISIGLSNIGGAFFSSMPITGAFSRTVVNKSSGVESPMGGIVTGVLVIVSLQFLTPYFYYIPKASLASVICCAVIFTVDFEIIYPMWKSKKMDLLPWFATFSISLLVGLEIGVLIGFLISIIFLLYYAARPGVTVNRGQTTNGYQFILIDMDRSMTFAATEYARYVIMKSGTKWGKDTMPVVIDCHFIQFADYTSAQGIRDLFKMFNEKKQDLILWRLKPSVVRILTSIMELGGVPFKHCYTEEQLENILEDSLKEREKRSSIKITFTVSGDEEEDSSSTNSTVDVENPPINQEDELRRNNNAASSKNSNLGSINYGAEIDISKE